MIGWTKVEKCPICKSRNKHPYTVLRYTPEDLSDIVKEIEADGDGGIRLDFYICECGLVYVNRILEDQYAYYHDLYTKIHMERIGEERLKSSELERAVRISDVWADVDKPVDVLDIGCGKGYFLGELEKKGYTGYGVDLRPDYAEDREVWGSLDEIPDIRFDIISMVHMLEHMLHPIEYLEGLRKFMKPDGALFIEVPSFTPAGGTLSINHPIGYTVHTLQDVVGKAGFHTYSVTVTPFRDASGIWKSVLQLMAKV